ncbi:MAG: glycoside hydrolase family 2 TIM barrel-domain containing protein [Acidobacteriaceae bacterium]
MDRRDFIRTTGGLLASAALRNRPAFAAAEHSTHDTLPGRSVLPMNRNWRYHPAKIHAAAAPGFDDSAFTRIVIPHTNVRLPWHNFDDKNYEFVSTYRRSFRLPQSAKGKRVFVDFEGAMTASTVWINGVPLGEYKGGYTPFSFELTPHLHAGVENVLCVQVDSTERPDIPPFGYEIDYMTFGGIYREVSLRIVPPAYIDNIFAHARDVLTGSPSLDVDCFLAGELHSPLTIEVELRDGERVIATGKQPVAGSASSSNPATEPIPAPVHASDESTTDPARQTVSLTQLTGINLWDLEHPHLYTVKVRLLNEAHIVDEDSRRIGFREATFTDHGFSLNGKIVKLRGLDRHQTFPFVGQAMPARVQRQDAKILRNVLHCNIVRTSHYPQSHHFLDCCDEVGLLVLEEIPGWQHIGDQAWKDLAVDNVGRMIRRDWNHPSVILWGVRINESRDDHDFYSRTNALAHALDTTRQTGGIRNFQSSEFLEDVFTMNDFGIPLKPPNHPRYLNTEFVGHTFPTKTTDDDERQREHTLRHARIHDQLASDPQYAGGIGWCAFDYNTHANFGSGDRICYHGVTDIFRELKPAGGFYRSQCDPAEEIVLEPAFHWARGDESVGFTKAVICSNCENLKLFSRAGSIEGNPWKLLAETGPDREQFPHLTWPPFIFDMHNYRAGWGDLRIEGYIQGKMVISKTLSGRGVDSKFTLVPDDRALLADGADTTRVVLRVTDEFGAARPYADDAIVFTLEGPAELIGDNPFSLIGGTGAIWIRAREQAGTVHLKAKHPSLGMQTISIQLTAAPPETI